MIWTGDRRCARLVHWFRSLAAIVLAAIVVILLLVVTRNSAGRYVKDWGYITDVYLNAEVSTTGRQGTVNVAVQAKNPGYFGEKLGFMTFGEGTHFAVHRQPGVNNGDIISQVAAAGDVRTSRRPLPYPPQSLWCVYLGYEDHKDVVIFLGYHRDMYSAEWIAHIGEQAPLSSAFLDLLSQLECEFPSVAE